MDLTEDPRREGRRFFCSTKITPLFVFSHDEPDFRVIMLAPKTCSGSRAVRGNMGVQEPGGRVRLTTIHPAVRVCINTPVTSTAQPSQALYPLPIQSRRVDEKHPIPIATLRKTKTIHQ